MKKKIKVYSVYILIFVVGFFGAYFIQKVRYEREISKIYAFTPQIVYRQPSVLEEGINEIVSKVYYGEWFNEKKDYPYFNYFRAFNKKYIVPLEDKEYSEVQGIVKNQILIYFNPNIVKSKIEKGKIPNYTNKCWFENELRKYTTKNFSILNIDNINQTNWMINFETELTKEEKEKLEKDLSKTVEDNFSITYNNILLPEYFKDYGRIHLSKGGAHNF